MAVEQRDYIGKIPIPFSRKKLSSDTPVSERQALISDKRKSYKGRIIDLFVESRDAIAYIQDVSEGKSPPVENTISRFLKGEEINKADIRVYHTRFKNRKFTWKEDK